MEGPHPAVDPGPSLPASSRSATQRWGLGSVGEEATARLSSASACVCGEYVSWTSGVGGDEGAVRMEQSETRQRSRGRSLG